MKNLNKFKNYNRKEKICKICGAILTIENTTPMTFKHRDYLCKECRNLKHREETRRKLITTTIIHNNFKNNGCRYRVNPQRICVDCGQNLTTTNCMPCTFKYRIYRCRVCYNKKIREKYLHHQINQRKGRIIVKDKLPHHPKNNLCMLCHRLPTRRTGLSFHHWKIIKQIAYGIWLCNVCHMFAERVDHHFLNKYLEIKQKIMELSL